MTNLMSSAAVGYRIGKDAAEILQKYIATQPAMVFNHTHEAPQPPLPRSPGVGGNQR